MFGIDDAIIGAVGGSLISGFLNNSGAEERQDTANTFSAQQYATRYQTTVKDMEAAGLNPMMAYQGISGSAPTGAVASSSGTPDLGSAITQGRIASAQVANIAADTENKKAQADLIEAQAQNQRASAAQATSSVARIEADTEKIREETKNIPTEGQRLKYAIQLLAEQAALAAQQGETQVSVRKELEAKISKLRAESSLLKFDIDAAESMGNLGRTSKEAKTVIDVLRTFRK